MSTNSPSSPPSSDLQVIMSPVLGGAVVGRLNYTSTGRGSITNHTRVDTKPMSHSHNRLLPAGFIAVNTPAHLEVFPAPHTLHPTPYTHTFTHTHILTLDPPQ